MALEGGTVAWRFRGRSGDRFAVFVEWIPEAEHQETGLADAHCPGHGFDGDFTDASILGGIAAVDDFAIIMVVAGESVFEVSDLLHELFRYFRSQDVLVLDACFDSDGVAIIALEEFASLVLGLGVALTEWPARRARSSV